MIALSGPELTVSARPKGASHGAAWIASLFVGVIGLSAAVWPGTAHAQKVLADAPSWNKRAWNPKVLDGDLELPMPCGAGMAFRRVKTPTEVNWLADLNINLGSADTDLGPEEYVRAQKIVGGFSDDGDPADRSYYLGKFEVTADQYAAVMSDACPSPTPAGSKPVNEVSWFDALTFTRRYSTWLLENHRDGLPREQDKPAYVRLPTEIEWEYAARGGSIVTVDEFRGRIPPVPGGLDAYAWYDSTASAGRDVNVIGRKAPNPLGLHDMLGNVEEMVLEPYRMNDAIRLHGQVGGVTAKGGSFNTDAIRMRSSMRIEYAPFNPDGTETRSKETGFRVVLSGLAVPSTARLKALRTDWAKRFALREKSAKAASPFERLDAAAKVAEPAVGKSIREASAALRTELAERNESDARAARSAIVAGAMLIRKYREDRRRTERFAKVEAIAEGDLKRQHAESKRKSNQVERMTAGAYFQILTTTAQDYDITLVQGQLPIVIGQFSRIEGDFAKFAELFVEQVGAYSAAPSDDRDYWLLEIFVD